MVSQHAHTEWAGYFPERQYLCSYWPCVIMQLTSDSDNSFHELHGRV